MRIVWSGVCSSLLIGAASGCSSHKTAAAMTGPPPIAVSVGRVGRQTVATYVSFNGQISPLYQATLSTPAAGVVSGVDATEGQFVSKGELLASLDTRQLEAQLAANEATVRQDQAALYRSGVQAPVASQQYSSAVTTAQQTLASYDNGVRTAQASLLNAQRTYLADLALVKRGYVSETDFAAARAAYVAARETLRNARQSVPAGQAALETAQTNTKQRLADQATIAQNRATVETAQANVQLLQTQIAQSSIYAPFDGQITERLIDPGAFAGANTPLLQISQVSTVYVVANVPDVDLPSVARGAPVTFTTSSLPGRTFHGTVFDINTVPTAGTLSYRVRLRQPNPDLTLRGGMLVVVTALQARHRDTTVVPRGAVAEGDSGNVVYRLVDNKAKMVPVDVGIQTTTLTEVHGPGLGPGAPIITSQPNGLRDGATVVVPSEASGRAGAAK